MSRFGNPYKYISKQLEYCQTPTRYAYTLTLFLLLMLSSCGDSPCIDPDDFNAPSYIVTARHQAGGTNGNPEAQIFPWFNSEITLDPDYPLVISVNSWSYKRFNNEASTLSAWTPWHGKDQLLNNYTQTLPFCAYENNDPSTGNITSPVPCLMTRGIGLYALLAPKGTNPNSTDDVIASPSSFLNFHVGASTQYGTSNGIMCPASAYVYNLQNIPERQGCLIRDIPKPSKTGDPDYSGGSLYFKILDSYYDDNAGQYIVSVKSGYVIPPNSLEVFANKTIDLILGSIDDPSNGIVPKLYSAVVQRESYRRIVALALCLYLVTVCFGFVLGISTISTQTLTKHIFKIVIISLLITPEESWNFFYNNFFFFFIQGSQQLKSSIIKAGASMGPGGDLLTLITSSKTYIRLIALVGTFNLWNIVYVVVYVFAMVKIYQIMLEFYCVYVAGMLAMGMVIALAPIFLCFILFDFTRELFNNWLKQLCYYAIQPIILFAGVALISAALAAQIYNVLGFGVCKYPIFQFSSDDSDNLGYFDLSFKYWAPVIGKSLNTSTNRVVEILAPNMSLMGEDIKMPYTYSANRNVDFPFLDPDSEYGKQHIANALTGKFAGFEDIMLLLITVYLFSKFNAIAMGLTASITKVGGALNAEVGQLSSRVMGYTSLGMKTLSYTGSRVTDSLQTRVQKRADQGVEKDRKAQIQNKKDKKEKKLDDIMEKMSSSEHTDKQLKTKVAQAVQKNSGLQFDPKYGRAQGAFRGVLQQHLTDIGVNVTTKEGQKLLEEMMRMDKTKLKDKFAQLMFSKEYKPRISKDGKVISMGYDNLIKEDQKKIDDLFTRRRPATKTQSNSSESNNDNKQIDSNDRSVILDKKQTGDNTQIAKEIAQELDNASPQPDAKTPPQKGSHKKESSKGGPAYKRLGSQLASVVRTGFKGFRNRFSSNPVSQEAPNEFFYDRSLEEAMDDYILARQYAAEYYKEEKALRKI